MHISTLRPRSLQYIIRCSAMWPQTLSNKDRPCAHNKQIWKVSFFALFVEVHLRSSSITHLNLFFNQNTICHCCNTLYIITTKMYSIGLYILKCNSPEGWSPQSFNMVCRFQYNCRPIANLKPQPFSTLQARFEWLSDE